MLFECGDLMTDWQAFYYVMEALFVINKKQAHNRPNIFNQKWNSVKL